MQQFFNNSKLQSLRADTLFASPLSVVLPSFNMYEHEFKNRITADAKMHLNMKKMATAAKNDEKVFETLTDPLLNGDIELDSTWPGINDIITYVSLALAIIASVGCVFLFLKLRKLSAMLVLFQQTHYVKAIDSSYIFKRTTTQAPENILDIIQENLKWDHVIFGIAIITFGMIIMLVISQCKRDQCGTTIILELTSGTTCAIIPLLSLPLCPSLLEINPPSSITNIILTEWPHGKIIADWINFTVTNKLQYSTVEIPTTVKLSLINRYRVAKIMKQPYMAYILLQHGRVTMPIPSMAMQKYFDYFKN